MSFGTYDPRAPGFFSEDSSIFLKAPYDMHKSVCEFILIKLGYNYDRNTESWSCPTQSKTICFEYSGVLLTFVVRYSPESSERIFDAKDNPLTFFSQFLEKVATFIQVRRPEPAKIWGSAEHYVTPGLNRHQIEYTLFQRFNSWEATYKDEEYGATVTLTHN